jgi:hypothetical protein
MILRMWKARSTSRTEEYIQHATKVAFPKIRAIERHRGEYLLCRWSFSTTHGGPPKSSLSTVMDCVSWERDAIAKSAQIKRKSGGEDAQQGGGK